MIFMLAILAGRPAANLLDLKPTYTVEDGLAVLRELRSHGNTTPVAVVTGHYGLDDETDAEIRQLHASIAYKPLWVENVLALVQDLLGTSPERATPPPQGKAARE
jgi:DNA-binding NtrC family response regulator